MQTRQSDHLAQISPVVNQRRGQVLNLKNLVLNAVLLVLIHTSWIFVLFAVFFTTGSPRMLSPALTALLLVLGIGFQVMINRCYPEWPLNHLVRRRLKRRLRRCGHLPDKNKHTDLVFAEWIPRDRWQGQHLDNAVDVMFARVEAGNLIMAGDQYHYLIPGASILDVEFQTVTLRGWMTPTHLVILTLRTEEGPIEMPMARRDFEFGSLRPSQRRLLTLQWCDELMSIARGSEYAAPLIAREPYATDRSSNPYHPPLTT